MMTITTARNETPEAPMMPRRRGRPTASVPPQMLSVVRHPDADGGVTLQVRGQLNLATVLSFRNDIFTVVGERPAYIALDLTELAQMEVEGIAGLVTVVRVARTVGVPMRLIPSPRLQRLLAETRLERLFSIDAPVGEEIAARILLG